MRRNLSSEMLSYTNFVMLSLPLKCSKLPKNPVASPPGPYQGTALGRQWHLDFICLHGISVFSFTKLGSWRLRINFSIILRFTLKLSLAAKGDKNKVKWSILR